MGGTQVAVAQICRGEIGTRETRTREMNPLQKGAGNIDPDQGCAVGVQLLESFDAAAIPAFPLRGVDDLPSLVMFLLETVAGLGEIEDHRDAHTKTSEIFDHFDERPIAEEVGDPLPAPLEGPKRHGPRVVQLLPADAPGFRAFSMKPHSHRENLPLGPRFYST